MNKADFESKLYFLDSKAWFGLQHVLQLCRCSFDCRWQKRGWKVFSRIENSRKQHLERCKATHAKLALTRTPIDCWIERLISLGISALPLAVCRHLDSWGSKLNCRNFGIYSNRSSIYFLFLLLHWSFISSFLYFLFFLLLPLFPPSLSVYYLSDCLFIQLNSIKLVWVACSSFLQCWFARVWVDKSGFHYFGLHFDCC